MNATNAFSDAFRQQFDFNQLFATQRRNLEAFSAANQVIVEGAQAITRRNAEILRENMESLLSTSREMFTGGSPENNIGRQTEIAREMLENSLATMREATEMATKSGFEAFDVLNKRAAESLEELGQSAGNAKRKKAA